MIHFALLEIVAAAVQNTVSCIVGNTGNIIILFVMFLATGALAQMVWP
jgi:hypothetical protein